MNQHQWNIGTAFRILRSSSGAPSMPGSGMLRASRSCKSQWMWWSPTIGREELIWARFGWRSPSITTSQEGLWGSEACRRAKTIQNLCFSCRWIGEWISMTCCVVFFPCLAVKCGVVRVVLSYLPVEQVESMMGCDGFQLYSAQFAIPVVSAVCRYLCEIWMNRKGTPCRCHCYTYILFKGLREINKRQGERCFCHSFRQATEGRVLLWVFLEADSGRWWSAKAI